MTKREIIKILLELLIGIPLILFLAWLVEKYGR